MLHKISIAAVILLSILATTALAQNDKMHQVDSILGAWYGEQTASVSAMIVHEGEVIVNKSYGFADLEEKVKAGSNSNYDLATLTEQFTVMGILMLMEEEKIDDDTPITEIWDDLPAYCEPVKVTHLVNHTSGLPVLQAEEFYGTLTSFDQLTEWMKKQDGLNFETGKRAGWNALNYALLANLIEKASGESYRKFVEDRIFKPLGMTESRVYKKGWFTGVPNQAVSYWRQGDGTYQPAGEFPKKYLEGAIGVYSNLDDMYKWLDAWQNDTLVSAKTLNQALRLNFIRGQKNFPGYGWIKAFNNGRKYMYKGGVAHGNSHIILSVPHEKIDVVILSNQSSLFGLRKRAFELVNLYSEKQYETR